MSKRVSAQCFSYPLRIPPLFLPLLVCSIFVSSLRGVFPCRFQGCYSSLFQYFACQFSCLFRFAVFLLPPCEVFLPVCSRGSTPAYFGILLVSFAYFCLWVCFLLLYVFISLLGSYFCVFQYFCSLVFFRVFSNNVFPYFSSTFVLGDVLALFPDITEYAHFRLPMCPTSLSQ